MDQRTYKEGTLQKLSVSAMLFKNWRTRRIVLLGERIEWHATSSSPTSKSGDVLKGFLHFGPDTLAYAHAGDSVVVQSDDKKLVIRMADGTERGEWLTAINERIKARRGGDEPS